MSKRDLVGLSILAAVLAGMLILFVSPVAGQPPENDDRLNPTIISTLPFSDQMDTSEATQAEDDPYVWCDSDTYYYGVPRATVWYEMTPTADMWIQATTLGSDYDTILVVFDGDGYDVDCTTSYAPVMVDLNAYETYSFMIGDRSGPGSYPYPAPGGGGRLEFAVDQLAGPDHDQFVDAAIVDSLPFTHGFDLNGATNESNEPRSNCAYDSLNSTVWYAFTPVVDGSYSAEVRSQSFYPYQAIYTGDSLQSLDELICDTGGGLLTIEATAGTTYYFQVGNVYRGDRLGPVSFSLDAAPPPVADFGYSPYLPSKYDEVYFRGYYSYDPANIGIESYHWNFGDGTIHSDTDCCPEHRFPDDGEYQVELTVFTYDGRSDSETRTLLVQTHDVAVTKFTTPKATKAGQTRPVSVGIRNHQYPETVTVRLYRSVPGGYEYLGNWTQHIPVRSGNRTTDVEFSYTFTDEDATRGKVTFRAEVDIHDYQDALPADNEAISRPTRVR